MPPNLRRDETSHGGPTACFATFVERLGELLDVNEASQLRSALDTTGALDLKTLPPSAVWALDDLWEALSAPDAPPVRSIAFPPGMAVVPEGVRHLPHLEAITLPEFKGDVKGGLHKPWLINVSVGAAASWLHFCIGVDDKIHFIEKTRPKSWSVVRYGPDGSFVHPQDVARARGTDGYKAQQRLRVLQKTLLAAARTPRGRRDFCKALGQAAPQQRHDHLWMMLATSVDEKAALPLLHHVQQHDEKQLRNVVELLVTASGLSGWDLTTLLMAAVTRHGQPTEEDLRLPDRVAEIIESLPKKQQGANPFVIRGVRTCFLPRADGTPCDLHQWIMTDAAALERFVDTAISSSQHENDLIYLFKPDRAGRTVLHIAVAQGRPALALMLVRKIAEAPRLAPHARLQLLVLALGQTTHDGDTLLWHAAARGRQTCEGVEPLLAYLATTSEFITTECSHLLYAALAHIERPRAAAAAIVRNVMHRAIHACDLDRPERTGLLFLTDALVYRGDPREPTLLQTMCDPVDVSSFTKILNIVQRKPALRLTEEKAMRYLLAQDAQGRTALHLRAIEDAAQCVESFITGCLTDPPPASRRDMSKVWEALDHRGRTPLWAAVEANAAAAASAFMQLAMAHESSDQPEWRAFADCIVSSLRRAGSEKLGALLSLRDGDKPLIRALAARGQGDLLTFLLRTVLSADLKKSSRLDLLAQAMRPGPDGSCLLDDAVADAKVLRRLLDTLINAKELTEPEKDVLLASLLVAPRHRLDRERIAAPVLVAVNRSGCSLGWKTTQQTRVDILSHDLGRPVPTQLHAAVGQDPAIVRARLRASARFAGHGNIGPERVSAYLEARDRSGMTAFDAAASRRRFDVLTAFLEVAAEEETRAQPAVVRSIVIDRFDAMPLSELTGLLAADEGGDTLLHALVTAGGGKALSLLTACMLGAHADADAVVRALASALAAGKGGKSLLWQLPSDGLEALAPVIHALAETTAWSSGQKETLWKALVGHKLPKPDAVERVLHWLDTVAGDQLPQPIRQPLADAARRPAPAAQVEVPQRAPSDRSYLQLRQVDLDHVLHGGLNARHEAVGGHALMTANRNRLRQRPGTPRTDHPNGTFTTHVDVRVAGMSAWVAKTEPSTFFPLQWTSGEIYRQIASALRRGDAFATGTGPWDAQSDGGIVIRFYRDRQSGSITCFPLAG